MINPKALGLDPELVGMPATSIAGQLRCRLELGGPGFGWGSGCGEVRYLVDQAQAKPGKLGNRILATNDT